MALHLPIGSKKTPKTTTALGVRAGTEIRTQSLLADCAVGAGDTTIVNVMPTRLRLYSSVIAVVVVYISSLSSSSTDLDIYMFNAGLCLCEE